MDTGGIMHFSDFKSGDIYKSSALCHFCMKPIELKFTIKKGGNYFDITNKIDLEIMRSIYLCDECQKELGIKK